MQILTAVFPVLLAIHIAAGATALAAGSVALLAPKGKWLHRKAGQVFFFATLGNTVASFGLAILRPNAFLFSIGVFSLYLAFSGWRTVTATGNRAHVIDWLGSVAMLADGAFMIGRAVLKMLEGTIALNPALLVFGVIGGAFALSDLRTFRSALPSGMPRVLRHLGRMIGAMIAMTTAVVVVNHPHLPELVQWLGPTACGSALIVYWNWRIRRKGLG